MVARLLWIPVCRVGAVAGSAARPPRGSGRSPAAVRVARDGGAVRRRWRTSLGRDTAFSRASGPGAAQPCRGRRPAPTRGPWRCATDTPRGSPPVRPGRESAPETGPPPVVGHQVIRRDCPRSGAAPRRHAGHLLPRPSPPRRSNSVWCPRNIRYAGQTHGRPGRGNLPIGCLAVTLTRMHRAIRPPPFLL